MKKSASLHFRIDPETLKALKAEAAKDERTISWVVTKILADWAKRKRR